MRPADSLIAGSAANGLDNVNCPVTEICVQATRKSAADAGVSKADQAAYDGVYTALGGQDIGLRDVFLNKTTSTDFFRDFNQMLPTPAGASLLSLSSGMDSVSRAVIT